jgi:hypothetical protein
MVFEKIKFMENLLENLAFYKFFQKNPPLELETLCVAFAGKF